MYPSGNGWATVGGAHSTDIINDYHMDDTQTSETFHTFPQFTRLPTEIAFAVWQHALEQHRLICITIANKDPRSPPPWARPQQLYSQENEQGRTISGRNYKLLVTTAHRLHPVLQASRESRQAALQFYRVHIPYDLEAYGGRRRLYINPEFDILILKTKGVRELLADFVHDVKAYDPREAGVLNMGMQLRPLHKLDLPTDPSSLLPPAASALTVTLQNLRRVFFLHVVPCDTRLMFGCLHMMAAHFNRSIPLRSHTEDFDLVEVDPRPIDGDLEMVSVGRDPRAMLYLWRKMEHAFHISREGRPVEFQFLITAPTHGRVDRVDIHSRADARTFLQFEQDLWRSYWEDGGMFRKWLGAIPETPEQVKQAPIPVIGFWLFPVDAFGEVPEGDFEDIRWGCSYEVRDLRKHRPRLGVFRLPRD